MPIPPGAGCVLLFGGSFDPPHAAHAELASLARDAVFPGGDARLVLIPAARSPHKAVGPVASGPSRVAMLRLAFRDDPRASVWTEELDRAAQTGEASYFVDTIRAARALLGAGADLRFLIGADQAASFHRWRAFREVLELGGPVVLPRSPLDTPERVLDAMAASGAWSGEELAAWRGAIAEVGVLDARATDVRAGASRGVLAPAVRAYIESHGLYAPA